MDTLPDKLYGAELWHYRRRVLKLYETGALTPVQLACLLGNNVGVCVLLQQFAEPIFGSTDAEELKTAFYLAVMGGHASIVKLFLHWEPFNADPMWHKAKHMAKYMVHTECHELLLNYVPRNFMSIHTSPLIYGADKPPIPKRKLHDVQRFVMTLNLHPVNVVLNFKKYGLIDHLEGVENSLKFQTTLLMNKNGKGNESLAMKLHYLATVISELQSLLNGCTNISKQENEEEVMRKFIKNVHGSLHGGVGFVQYILRKFMNSFPFSNSALLEKLRTALAEQDPTVPATWVLRNTLNNGALQLKTPQQLCNCCESAHITRICTMCKRVQYCSKQCVEYHKIVHVIDCE